jgi:2-phospho-L-lactate guanylyltransferase (CobY/MobA/RfbA family)
MVEGVDDVQVARGAARRCHSRLSEAWSVEERRALLRLMVELWDRADELECRRSSGVSPGHE